MSAGGGRPRIPKVARPTADTEPLLAAPGGRVRGAGGANGDAGASGANGDAGAGGHSDDGGAYREDWEIQERGRRSGFHLPTTNQLAHEIASDAKDQARRDFANHPISADAISPATLHRANAVVVAAMDSECPVSVKDRAAAVHAGREAQQKRNLAEQRLSEARMSLRRARAQLERIGRPMLGQSLATDYILWALAGVAGLLETFITKRALEIAFSLHEFEAFVAAGLLSVFMVVAFENFGASLVRDSSKARKPAAAMAVLATLAATAIAFTVLMADSREYNESLASDKSERPTRGFGQRSGFESAAGGGKSERPDLDFTIPLTLFLFGASVLAGMRSEAAAPWRSAREEANAAEDEVEIARDFEGQVRLSTQAALAVHTQTEIAVAAHTDSMRDRYVFLVEHYRRMYERECVGLGIEPRRIAPPPAPDPVEAAIRVMNPAEPFQPTAAPTDWDTGPGPGPVPGTVGDPETGAGVAPGPVTPPQVPPRRRRSRKPSDFA